jgi:aldehyde dehydrogenase (NAD+)
VGPLANSAQLDKVEEYVRLASEEGARLVTGGHRPTDQHLQRGLYYAPTIFAEVDNSSRLAQEEVFGPIMAVIPFDSEAEALALANDSDYGLAAGVWTSNISRAQRMIRALQSGAVFVNTYRTMAPGMPVGGFKKSGVGRENGMEAILGFTRVKSVWIEAEPVSDDPFKMRF